MTKVHICAFNADQYQDRLEALFPELNFTIGKERSDLGTGIEDCDILIAFGPMLNDQVFEANRNIRWVQALGTGVDGIADRDALAEDVLLSSMRGIHGPQMSEMAFLMMLSLNRKFARVLENQKSHTWARWPGEILELKTVGIWGVGLIAEALAKRCKAFDMTVVGITNMPRTLEHFDRMIARTDVIEGVKDLDYLVVLAPYTPENEGMVSAEVLAAMKPSAYLINLARGKVADDQAIIDAVTSGQIAGAGLDVFDEEPLPADSPFWDLPNVIVTPHMGGMSEAYVRQAMPVIEHNLRAYLENRPTDMINKVER